MFSGRLVDDREKGLDALIDRAFWFDCVRSNSIDDEVLDDAYQDGLAGGVQAFHVGGESSHLGAFHHLVLPDFWEVGVLIESIDVRATD